MYNDKFPTPGKIAALRLLNILVILLISVHILKAQDYAAIKPGQVPYFMKTADHYLFAIKVDSVSTDSIGQTFEFYKQWSFYSNSGIICPILSNWIGPRCRLDANGEYIFETDNGEEVKIKSLAMIGESWDFYQDLDGNRVVASVLDMVENSVLDGLDSIKIINLQLLDSNGILQNSPINDFQIHLSKSHGLTRMVHVRDFPQAVFQYDLDGYYSDNQEYNVLTWKEIFDYQVGDEFHYWAMADINLGDARYTIYRVLNRTESSGGQIVSYQMEREIYPMSTQSGSVGIVWADLQLDTITQEYNFENDSILIPGQAILSNRPHVLNLQYAMKYSGLYLNRRVIEGKGDIIELGELEYYDGCVNEYESNDLQYNYGEGLGLTNYYLQYFDGVLLSGNLTYYRKGTEEYGTPLSMDEKLPALFNQTIIYPNPGTGIFHVQADNIQAITIYNVSGQLIRELEITQPGAVQFNLCGQSPGIYYVHLMTPNSRQIKVLMLL